MANTDPGFSSLFTMICTLSRSCSIICVAFRFWSASDTNLVAPEILLFCIRVYNITEMILFHFSVEVLTTLTADVGRILSKLHQVQPKGNIKFCTAVKVAHVSKTVEND